MAPPKQKPPPNPAKSVAIGFAVAILIGAAALMLPAARHGAGGAPFNVALFTATSAVCVTGLTIVDTATYWTPFGQTLIMLLIQIGGLGIMTGASLLFLAVSRRIGLRNRMIARQERGSVSLGDVRNVMLAVIGFSVLFEAVIAVVLTARFWQRDDISFGTAVWRGIFHAVSAFNNAGFALFSDSLARYALDPFVLFTIAIAVVTGGLGFPIWLELRRRWRQPDSWSLHSKLTIAMTAIFLFGGWILISVLEWGNDQTIGREDGFHKLTSGFFASAASRTAGFSTFDYQDMSDSGVMVTQMLMFAGGGSGSTAGGIKVTTFAVLILAAISEIKGAPDVSAFGRRIATPIQRQALTVAFASINAVAIGAVILMILTPHEFERTLFEAVSAFATTGLSLGVTQELSGGADFVVIMLMYLGRIGPLTLAVALLLRRHPRRFRYPEERPLVG